MQKPTYSRSVQQELASIHPLYARPGESARATSIYSPIVADAKRDGLTPRKCARLVMAADVAGIGAELKSTPNA